WECTRTLRLAVPGVPSVERNETALADDQAAGRQWLSHAYLSGADQQLYRLPLGGGRYIWIDDAGARWLVDATALHGQEWRPDAPPPVAVTITLTRFGVFTTAPAPAPVSLTVA